MGKKSNRKRRASGRLSDAEVAQSPSSGLAGALAFLQKDGEEPSPGAWTEVSPRPIKKRKREKSKVDTAQSEHGDELDDSRRPALKFAPTHKLQRMLKIADLQQLVLYVLADGTGPQWVSIRHHAQIQKCVVLMVPGLEKGMFNGEIKLLDEDEGGVSGGAPKDGVDGEEHRGASPKDEIEEKESKITEYNPHQRRFDIENGPDDYLPLIFDKTNLVAALMPLADIFEHVWPIKTPGEDKFAKLHSPLHAMLSSAIPKTQEEKKIEKQKGVKPAQQMKTWENQRTPITYFLATREELQDSDYVLHPALYQGEEDMKFNAEKRKIGKMMEHDGWKDTAVKDISDGLPPENEIEQGSITAGRVVYAIDCEMCMVDGEDGADEYALTRISIVGWDGAVILDELVKPEKPIKNYLTQFSGMTQELLDPITTSLPDIQNKLLELFTPRTILVGHSLESDLRALKLTHPFIVDSSIIFPHPRGPPLKSSLKWLTQKYLSREIQKGHGTKGHDSIEDARATLELVRQKCERGPKWGTFDANNESIFKRLVRSPKNGVSTPGSTPGVDASSQRVGKTGAIVDHGAPERTFGSKATYCIGCKNDTEVVAGVKRAMCGDVDGSVIPGGGVNFTWARLRDLEALRGWWNDNGGLRGAPPQAPNEPSSELLTTAVAKTVNDIKAIRESLPPRTLLIIYSGTGDPREMARMQEMHRTYKREYATKKWDQLSVKWTDVEEQALRNTASKARKGVGFVCLS